MSEEVYQYYEPLTDPVQTRDKLQGVLDGAEITNTHLFEGIADVFATRVTVEGNDWQEEDEVFWNASIDDVDSEIVGGYYRNDTVGEGEPHEVSWISYPYPMKKDFEYQIVPQGNEHVVYFVNYNEAKRVYEPGDPVELLQPERRQVMEIIFAGVPQASAAVETAAPTLQA